MKSHQERLARRRAVAEMIAGGASIHDACAAHGLSVNYVKNVCREFGVRASPNLLPRNEMLCVCLLLTTRDDLHDIASKCGMSTMGVRGMIKRMVAVGLRPRSESE